MRKEKKIHFTTIKATNYQYDLMNKATNRLYLHNTIIWTGKETRPHIYNR